MIRHAHASDADWIAGIWNAVIAGSTASFTTEPRTPADIAAMIAARAGAFVVDPEVGFATFGPFRAGVGYRGTAEHTIHIAQEHTGQAHGARLLSALEIAARAAGKHTLVGGISGSNPGALRFHLQQGYAQVARMPGVGEKWGERLDLVLVQKTLHERA